MVVVERMFGGAEVSLVLTQEGPVDCQSGHRVQGRRRAQNRAANPFFGLQSVNKIAVREEASLRRVCPSGFAARLAQAVFEVGDRLLVLRYGRGFLVNF